VFALLMQLDNFSVMFEDQDHMSKFKAR